MSLVRIVAPGDLVITRTQVRITGWTFDTSDCSEPVSNDHLAAAVRDYIIERIDQELTDRSLCLQVGEPVDTPVTIEAERRAEMETYLLINRCQGNG